MILIAESPSRRTEYRRYLGNAGLGKLGPEVTKVNLGPGKGVYYRLKVGPVDSADDATDLCRKLKKRRQYCEPSFIGAS